MNPRRLYIYQLICKFLPLTRCYGFKASMLRWCGAKVGKNVRIVSNARIVGDFNLIIGDNVFIGHEALIFGPAKSTITLETNCRIGSRVILVTGSHEITPLSDCIIGKGIYADICIKSGAAICTNSLVLPGKTVNNMAMVAAGSVVTHDVPAYCCVAGAPARVIKNWKIESGKPIC